MKVLVVGSLPPPPGGHRDALLADVLRRRELGDEVEIVALDQLSVAHHHLSAPGLPGVVELALLARGASVIVLQIEPGLPVRHHATRAERTAALMALARVLKGRQEVILRLDNLDDLPGGPGGRAATELWQAASRIEVRDEELAEQLKGVNGQLADRIHVADPAPMMAAGDAGPATWGEGEEATAERVQAVVRRRAAEQRLALGQRGLLPVHAGGQGTRVALWPLLPVPGAGVPDLGPSKLLVAARRAQMRTAPPSPARVVRVVLARAETWSVTRPIAHLGRLGWSQLRTARKR